MRRVLRGPLKLDPVSLRDWLPRVGVTPPQTTDPEALKKLSFSGAVALTKTSAEVNDIVMQLDETTMKGALGVADLASKALRFDLSIDRINADRYLPPPSEGEGAPKSDKEPPAEIPVDALRKLNARGQIRVGEAIFAGVKFTKLRLGVNARDGRVRFNPSEASMYGGQYRGDISIDATGDVARVTLDEHVSGVDFAPLFRDLFETNRVSGKGSANIKLAGAGRNTDDIMKTLDGAARFQRGRRRAGGNGSLVRDPSCSCCPQAASDSPARRSRAHAFQRARRNRRDARRRADQQGSERGDAVPQGDGSGRSRHPEEHAGLQPRRGRAQGSARRRRRRAVAGHGGRARSP